MSPFITIVGSTPLDSRGLCTLEAWAPVMYFTAPVLFLGDLESCASVRWFQIWVRNDVIRGGFLDLVYGIDITVR